MSLFCLKDFLDNLSVIKIEVYNPSRYNNITQLSTTHLNIVSTDGVGQFKYMTGF